MNQRLNRLGDSLRGEISAIVQREMKDPRVQLATISQVHVTRDLSHAKVFVSALGSDEERARTIEALVKAKGFVRSQLAARLRLRTVPELHFELDRGAEHSQRMTEILEHLHDED
jgi:ribosome-binding factor A